mmetsp:Transcript_41494/g.79298  ORF Transcript_41494/g.79298 Transcript_41494/m.79298 type:complete len:225 (+) Transcript_41494:195-869(+)
MLVKVLLQFFVGEVDTKLLKRVLLEALEPVDIQHADASHGLRILPNGIVDGAHQPVEEARVQSLGQGVAAGHRIQLRHRPLERLLLGDDGSNQQRLVQQRSVSVEQRRHAPYRLFGRLVRELGLFLSRKLDVAQVQHCSHDAPHRVLLGLGDAHDAHGAPRARKLLRVIHPREFVALALVEVVELARGLQLEALHFLWGSARAQLVENVVVALRICDLHQARAL